MDDNKKLSALAGYRRDLHRIPELGRELPKTTAYIHERLAGLPCEIREAGDAGFCALFRANAEATAKIDTKALRAAGTDRGKGNGTAPAIAFRTDMDALPVAEATGFPFASEHEGRMHACGHDGHMAIMLGFADELAERVKNKALTRDAALIFQAAEESVGGAKDICESGILQGFGVGSVYGIHLWPGYAKHEILCRKGEFMAAVTVFSIHIRGKSVHVGTYKQGIDALEIACDFVRRVYEMEQKEVAPDIHRLLRFGIIQSGAAPNVVSDHAYLEGTLRTYSKGVNDLLWNQMVEIADGFEAKTGCVFAFEHNDDPYPAVINPPALFDSAHRTLRKAGFEWTELELPLMVSEDFSFYQRHFPGLFLYLATGVDKPLHSGDYTIDEDVLLTGVRIYEALLDGELAGRSPQ
jgi:hippurate hydrolase